MDILLPGFTEVNLNKKVKGAQKSNILPVITLEDAGRMMNSVTLTWRMVVSILAKLYDPCGFWEPWKLQFKLMSQSLAGMDWDKYIPAEDQDLWKKLLLRLVNLPKLSIPRICSPADKDSVSGIRLICLTDAATTAGGAAIYAGRKMRDSTWSCALVASKSKLMKATVPRNELSAIMLGTETDISGSKINGHEGRRYYFCNRFNNIIVLVLQSYQETKTFCIFQSGNHPEND